MKHKNKAYPDLNTLSLFFLFISIVYHLIIGQKNKKERRISCLRNDASRCILPFMAYITFKKVFYFLKYLN